MPSTTPHKIDDYESLLLALQNVLGVVVPEEQRSNLVERVEPLLLSYQLGSLASLAEKLQNDEDGVRIQVLDIISRNQSGWILNTEVKNILHKYIFSQLSDNARIWITGCGQGQIAYSIAMEMANYEHISGEEKNCQFVATSILQDEIDQANSAIYSTQQLSTLSDENKKLYVTVNEKEGNGQVKDKIRNVISFSQFDVTQDLQPLGKMDLIICPEVLVYFSNGVKTDVLQQIVGLLKSGGIFLTGGSQVIPADQDLERVDHSEGVFYRQKS